MLFGRAPSRSSVFFAKKKRFSLRIRDNEAPKRGPAKYYDGDIKTGVCVSLGEDLPGLADGRISLPPHEATTECARKGRR